jgi:hypothetical protein
MSESYIAGLAGGATGVLISHPFDTIKTMYQMDGENRNTKLSHEHVRKYTSIWHCTTDINKNGGFLSFYKGIKPPIIGVGLEKCIVFGTYNTMYQYTNNIFASGVLAGLLCTSIVTPLEKVKILQQQNIANSSITHVLKQHVTSVQGMKKLYTGWSATLGREVPGFGIYFSTYEKLKQLQKGTSIEHGWLMPFFNGSLSGASAWLFIYPSDPVKTLMQTKNTGLIESIKHIYEEKGIRGFYRGFGLGLFRAIPLHGGVFLGYELCTKLFKSI